MSSEQSPVEAARSFPLLCRSLLNTPALDSSRFSKASEVGADVGVIDLEDSVPLGAKAAARALAVKYLAASLAASHAGATLRAVRINTPRSQDGLRDILALVDGGARLDFVLVPKVESPEELRLLDEVLAPSLPRVGLLALIETARAVERAAEIAVATPRLRGLVFGGADMSSQLGVPGRWESLLYARSRIVMAAALGGILAIDTPFFALEDAEGLAREVRLARELGFSGKVAIHPRQIAPIHEGFSPSPRDVAHAQAVVARAEGGGGEEIYVVQGAMVGPPLLRVARRVLERACPPYPQSGASLQQEEEGPAPQAEEREP